MIIIRIQTIVYTFIISIFLLCQRFTRGFAFSISNRRIHHHCGRYTQQSQNVQIQSSNRRNTYPIQMSSQFSMEEVPLNQIFQKAVVLQRSGDRDGALDQYKQFLKVAKSHDVDPSLYAEVHANTGAIFAMKGERIKAKEALKQATKYRPSLGSAWVNLALLIMAEGKEMGNSISDQTKVKDILKEARQCCERALGMDNDDEKSRALANKLLGDIDSMLRQMN